MLASCYSCAVNLLSEPTDRCRSHVLLGKRGSQRYPTIIAVYWLAKMPTGGLEDGTCPQSWS